MPTDDDRSVVRKAVRGPSWWLTKTWSYSGTASYSGDDAPVRPVGQRFAPCSLRGTSSLVNRRWIAGHLHIEADDVLWWRHNGPRRTALAFPREQLRLKSERAVERSEWVWISPHCVVFDVRLGADEFEFALVYAADADDLRAATA